MIKRRDVFALVFFALAAAPCSADIYGFVDDQGRSHFSDLPLDSRYELYVKDRPQADEAAQAEVVASPERKTPAFEPSVSLRSRRRYADMIVKVAREQKVEPALLHAVVAVESSYNARARSPSGAAGLMQLMPLTAKRYGVRHRLNPLENLRGGARYLKDLLELFDNNLRLVIAAYNAGEGAVIRAGNAIPSNAETRAYVPRVMQYYRLYRARHQDLQSSHSSDSRA